MEKVVATDSEVYCRFKSLTDFLKFIEEGEISQNFIDAEKKSSETGDYELTGTHSFKEALMTCREGEYSDDFDRFDKKRIEFEQKIEENRGNRKTKRDFIGYAPNVPAYLIGHPLNMFNSETAPSKAKPVIRIFMETSCPWNIPKERIITRGIFTLALIKQLEEEGYNVELSVFDVCRESGQILINEIPMKKTNEPIDYRKIYFPFVNASFLRRLLFRLIEIVPELNSNWTRCYGTPCKEDVCKSVVEEYSISDDNSVNVVVGTPEELRLSGELSDEQYEQFMKNTGIYQVLGEAKNRDEENDN